MICEKTRRLLVHKDADVHHLIVMVEVFINLIFTGYTERSRQQYLHLEASTKLIHVLWSGKVQHLFL